MNGARKFYSADRPTARASGHWSPARISAEISTMKPMSAARVVLITHPREGAEEFARGLVERRLAACVNLLAARSIYRWEGEVHADDESLLVAKTDAARLVDLEQHLPSAHPYDVPECIALAPDAVEPRYLAWMLAETASEAPADGPSTGGPAPESEQGS